MLHCCMVCIQIEYSDQYSWILLMFSIRQRRVIFVGLFKKGPVLLPAVVPLQQQLRVTPRGKASLIRNLSYFAKYIISYL